VGGSGGSWWLWGEFRGAIEQEGGGSGNGAVLAARFSGLGRTGLQRIGGLAGSQLLQMSDSPGDQWGQTWTSMALLRFSVSKKMRQTRDFAAAKGW
jgi:hypothetical protein